MTAFNHLTQALSSGDPQSEGSERDLFFPGDDRRAKTKVAAIIDQFCLFGIDLGPLSIGGRLVQIPGGSLPAPNLVMFG